jgi:hypothetical protein
MREQRFAIGRIVHVSPIAGERFYIRLLLTKIPGPISFVLRSRSRIVLCVASSALHTPVLRFLSSALRILPAVSPVSPMAQLLLRTDLIFG